MYGRSTHDVAVSSRIFVATQYFQELTVPDSSGAGLLSKIFLL